MVFTVLDKPAPDPFPSLNDAQKNAITDIYITTNNPMGIRESKVIADLWDGEYMPTSVADMYFNKIKKITAYCSQLMMETVWPTTLTKLKSEAYKHYPECTQAPFEYLIDKMIAHSTVAGTFAAYKYYFDNLDPNNI